jgi:hypothetical protein
MGALLRRVEIGDALDQPVFTTDELVRPFCEIGLGLPSLKLGMDL